MKKEVQRERELPAFVLTVGELETLWLRLSALFDNSENIHASITVQLPSEILDFENIQELQQYNQLPARITNFTVRLIQNEFCVTIYSRRLINSKARVSATSGSEAWCAGAIETVYSFVQSHKLWYSWFVSAPIGWILVLVVNSPAPMFYFMQKNGIQITSVVVFGWLGAFITLFILYFGRERLLPSAILTISESRGFVRSHVAELSLAIAIVSAILTVIGWFVSK